MCVILGDRCSAEPHILGHQRASLKRRQHEHVGVNAVCRQSIDTASNHFVSALHWSARRAKRPLLCMLLMSCVRREPWEAVPSLLLGAVSRLS